jgi:hypothetical protein
MFLGHIHTSPACLDNLELCDTNRNDPICIKLPWVATASRYIENAAQNIADIFAKTNFANANTAYQVL